MELKSVTEWLWLVPVLALLAAGFRILYTGNARKYPLLLALICVTVLTSIAAQVASAALDPVLYSRLWVAAYVAIWSFTALALTEVCTKSFEPYEEFGRIGQKIIQGVLIATGIMIASWLLLAPRGWASRFLDFFQSEAYLVQSSLALLGVSVWMFVSWARLRLGPNARLAMTAITVFCAGEALLGSGISAEWPSMAFYIGIGWTTLCWGAIAVLWVRQPAEAAVKLRQSSDQVAAQSAVSDLETTNAGLAGIVRRG